MGDLPASIAATFIFTTAASLGAVTHIAKAKDARPNTSSTQVQDHRYLGMWVTGNGHIRQELLPTGRYDEGRGDRRSA